MAYVDAPPMTLMQLWRLHKCSCRAIGTIISEARSGQLPGVEPLASGIGFVVTDQAAALAAMAKG